MDRVEVVWIDSHRALQEWTDRGAVDEKELELAECSTVGYLFRDTPDKVVLLMNLSPEQVGDAMVIPRSVILEVRKLRIDVVPQVAM